MKRTIRLLLSICVALLTPLALAAPPPTINYQGYLTGAPPGNTPITSTLSMTFRLYDAQSVGTLLFSESQSVSVNNGVFNVVLGTGTLVAGAPLGSLTFNVPYFLEVVVGAEMLVPRMPLSTNPYAFRAATADSVALGASGVPVASGTLPPALAFGAVGSVGISGQYARADHAHPMTSLPALSGDLTGSLGSPITVTALRGTLLSATSPLDQQILTYSSSSARAAWQTPSAAVIPASISLTGNLTLSNPSTAIAGNIFKGTTRFIHNFGFSNTFIGESAGNFGMSGSGNNTGAGVQALLNNTTGAYNTAIGVNALYSNLDGSINTAIGAGALQNNTSGINNTATGVNALLSNTTGINNTASGTGALQKTTVGTSNTASGTNALFNNVDGVNNTAIGADALFSNTAGSTNTAIGTFALANALGANNIALGYFAGANVTSGASNIYIGHPGFPADDRTIRIGATGNQSRTFISSIYGVTIGGSAHAVSVDSNGQLGTTSSSRRYKDDITDMDAASSALMQLRPVTFHYKSDQNPAGRTLQYGLIAEEVNEIYPGLVVHSADGQIETVMYQHLPPMLLNEFQKQQRTIAAQAARISELEQKSARVDTLESELRDIKVLLRIR